MKKKQVLRIVTDVLMTAALVLLMSYSLLGEAAHEWIGVAMLALFVTHHVLNRRWFRGLFKGKYTPFRILQTALVLLIFAGMIGSAVSGAVLSRYALDFLPIRGGRAWAREVHMLCAYWDFVLMSLHLGLHWNMMLAKLRKTTSEAQTWLLRIAALGVAMYGIYAFAKQDILNYLLLRNHFVFFDFDAPRIVFYLDYIAIMGLFIFIGHYLARWLRRGNRSHESIK